MSRPAKSACRCRNDSLINLLIRFRPVARRQCFLEIARPSLGLLCSLRLHSTVNNLSRLRVAFSNTRPKAAASSNRLSLENRILLLLVNLVLWLVVEAGGEGVTASTAHGLSRDGASTRGARPWWPSARETRGYGRALFCWAEMCVSLFITWVCYPGLAPGSDICLIPWLKTRITGRPLASRTVERAARVRRCPDSVNRLM